MARSTTGGRTRRASLAAVAAASVGAVGFAALAPSASVASSHREAPLVSQLPLVDNTDTYAFVDPKDTSKVNLVANWLPFELPGGGPNFYKFATDAQYNINIDNDGDGKADVVYQWAFHDDRTPRGTFLYNKGPVTNLSDPDLLFRQTYSLTEIKGGVRNVVIKKGLVAPSYVGQASMPNYARLRQQAITSYSPGARSFAGQAQDSFFLDIRIFDLLYGAKLSNGAPAETGNDSLKNFNVQTLALQVPKAALALKGDVSRNPVVGVWSTTTQRGFIVDGRTGAKRNVGGFTTVSRLGAPLVNEVVIPYNDKDKFNTSKPQDDGANFAKYILTSHVAQLLNAVYGTSFPTNNRKDLVAAFATGFDGINAHSVNKDVDKNAIVPAEEIRLNMGLPYFINGTSPSPLGAFRVKADGTLGVGADGGDTGFPNGRRLTDDVVDIELQAIGGVLLPKSQGGTGGKPISVLTDRVGAKPRGFFTDGFPYVAIPASGGDPLQLKK